MARHQLLEAASAWFEAGHFRRELARRVARRTESDAGPPGPALGAYLRHEIAPSLDRLGFVCRVLDNPVAAGGPMLVARRIEGHDLPTVLTYGHGDVVAGQDGHRRDGPTPWELTVEGERWYGRGTADNKGQHTINFAANFAALGHAIAARAGRLGYNVTVLLEMGEEAGSPGLRELCERERESLRADLLIACDGPRVQARRPTLFLGSRGAINFSLRLRSRERAQHSGNWGGVLTNPGTVLAHAVASLVDGRGRILVEGLRPPPLADNVRRALHDLDIGGGDDDPPLDPAWGEPGLTAAERLVGWNTLEVLALGTGSAERPMDAIPPSPGCPARPQTRFGPNGRANVTRASGSGSTRRGRVSG